MMQEIEVLLVEDNESDAEMTIRALNKHNLANRLLHVRNGAEALDFIFGEGAYHERQTEHLPNVIFLDLKMPKVNGIEVLRRLKSDVKTKKIPVIIFTSSMEDPDIQECYDLGVNGYVVKPVEFPDFAKAVSDLGLYWIKINEPPQ